MDNDRDTFIPATGNLHAVDLWAREVIRERTADAGRRRRGHKRHLPAAAFRFLPPRL